MDHMRETSFQPHQWPAKVRHEPTPAATTIKTGHSSVALQTRTATSRAGEDRQTSGASRCSRS
eukprot:6183673-Pleurochrysis_carterae.AAC.5